MVALTALVLGLMGPLQVSALKCDRIGDGVRVLHSPVLALTGELTLEAWIKPESVDIGGPFHFIVSKNYGGTGFALVLIGKGDAVRLQFEANDTIAYPISMQVLKGRWWHVAGVFRSGKDISLYVNGLEVARKTATAVLQPNELPLWIGASPWDQFIGSIADVRIWNVARNPNQIFTDKDRRLSGTEGGLVANWNFKSLSKGKTFDLTHHTKPGEVVGRARIGRSARR